MGFEYSNFMKSGKLPWGEDMRAVINMSTAEEQKKSAARYLNEVFEIVRKRRRTAQLVGWFPSWLVPKNMRKRWTRGSFNLTFRALAVFLGSRGFSVGSKEEIASTFSKTFHHKEELCNIASTAAQLWERWKSEPLSPRDAKKFLQNSLAVVEALNALEEAKG
jgi:hypothetical protein